MCRIRSYRELASYLDLMLGSTALRFDNKMIAPLRAFVSLL